MIRQCSSRMIAVTAAAPKTISMEQVLQSKTRVVVNKTFPKFSITRKQQQNRFLSSETSTTSTTTTIAAGRTDGIIISRRVWNELVKLKPIVKDIPKSKPIESTSTSSSWPRSVQIFGYLSGIILIPYLFVWCIVVATPTIRNDYFFPLLSMLPIPISDDSDTDESTDKNKNDGIATATTKPKKGNSVSKKDNILIELIRKHYGEIDWDNISYIEQHVKTIQYKLYDELTQEQRYQQKLIQYYNISATIQQSVQFYLPSSTTSVTLSDIPSSIVLSSTNTLLQWLQQSIKKSSNDKDDKKYKEQLIQYYQQNPDVPILIDFPEPTEKDSITNNSSNSNLSNDSIDPTQQQQEQIEQHPIPKKDDFVKKMNLYSYWYYQDPAHILSSSGSSSSSSSKSNKKQQPTQTSTTTSTTTTAAAAAVATNKSSTPIIVYDTNINVDDENKLLLLIQQYEYDINQLQIELNDGSPTRHVDTILDELEYKKQQLRSAQWNRVSNKLKFW